MEMLRRVFVERALVLTCCLVISPTITTTPLEDLGSNSENTVRISRSYHPGDDSSKEDTWNYNYPRFSIPLQDQLTEAKRRSSFFPVRGKKVGQNAPLPEAGTPTEYPAIVAEAADADGRTFFPVIRGAPHSFYYISRNGDGYVHRYPNEQQQVVENAASGALGLGEPSLNWQQPQKRRSSFMPMRGRKRYTSGNNLELLRRYLAARGDSLGLAYGNYQTNFPSFHDQSKKGDKNFPDRDLRPLGIKEAENAGTASHPKSFPSGKITPTKRALSFVPTRGRREKSAELVSEFSPHVPQTAVDWPDFPDGRMATNFSRYTFEEEEEDEEKTHQRYRRASAFLPMRGRKSSGPPHWLGYNGYLPRYVDRVQGFGDSGRRDSVENMWQQSSEDNEMQGLMFGEDSKYTAGQRQKKSLEEEGLKSSVPQQKLRTVVVMKRPLSFFAARGKRLDGE